MDRFSRQMSIIVWWKMEWFLVKKSTNLSISRTRLNLDADLENSAIFDETSLSSI
jgi:hypothetical protein